MSDRITRNRKMYDPSAFIKMDVDVLLELEGDYEACALYAYLEYLLATKGAEDNGGWVILSYLDIEEHLYMKRRAVDRAVTLLKKIGLKTELKSSRFHGGAPVKHFQFDTIIYDEALGRIEASYSLRKTQRHEEFKQRRTGAKLAFVQNEQKPFVQNEQILEDVSLEEVIKEMETPATKVASLEKSSMEKNTPPTPTTHNRAVHNGSHPTTTPPKNGYTPYELIGREIRRKFFNIADDITPDEKTLGKSQRLAGWLINDSPRPANESIDEKVKNLLTEIGLFTRWYSKKLNGAILPHSPESLSTHWLAFLSTKPSHTPTASYVMQEWGGVKTGDTNFPATGGGGDTMMVDNNIFGFLFGNRKDNGNE